MELEAARRDGQPWRRRTHAATLHDAWTTAEIEREPSAPDVDHDRAPARVRDAHLRSRRANQGDVCRRRCERER
jgi:hypothetical protein